MLNREGDEGKERKTNCDKETRDCVCNWIVHVERFLDVRFIMVAAWQFSIRSGDDMARCTAVVSTKIIMLPKLSKYLSIHKKVFLLNLKKN